MLENSKSLIAFGLDTDEINMLHEDCSNIIKVTDEMVDMKVKDIINKYDFKSSTKKMPKEKIILFNNYSDDDISAEYSKIKKIIPEAIIAVVTKVSAEWSFSELIEHLIEEREWYRNKQKG